MRITFTFMRHRLTPSPANECSEHIFGNRSRSPNPHHAFHSSVNTASPSPPLEHQHTDWQRLLLMCALWPVLGLQAMHVRRITPCMPEPPGCRTGTAGEGPPLRLLVAGDSGAAGVGVGTQDEGLCGQLVRCLSLHHTVHWRVLAANGLDSPGLLHVLDHSPCERFDVVVLSIGANDATRLLNPLLWARWQERLATLIGQRFEPSLLVHSAVPPMHACLALPQPLRWFMGRWARQMNQALAGLVFSQSQRIMHWHPDTTTTLGMAEDGFHPSATGYAEWAQQLSPRILNNMSALLRDAHCSP